MLEYEVTPRQAKALIKEILDEGLVPFVRSSPGMGKSSMVHSIVEEANLHLIDHRISTSQPEDMTGLPKFLDNGKATFVPFDIFPIEGDKIPNNKNGFMVFLDEFNSGKRDTIAASYKLILDRYIGQSKLHKDLWIVAAGNLDTDRAIVNNIGSAMTSRFINLKLRLDFNEFVEDVMVKYDWDYRVSGYLHFAEDDLMNFNPAKSEDPFNCPRTWDFLQRLIRGKEVVRTKMALYGGTISAGTATNFVNFVDVYKNLPKIEDIVRNPDQVHVPTQNNVCWAITTFLVDKTKKDNFAEIAQYMHRMGESFRVLYYRMLLKKQPALRQHPSFAKEILVIGKWLHDL